VATVTSRHNPIVARYRAAARGEDRSLMLVDGVHLVADALAAAVALHDVTVAAGADTRPDAAALLDALTRARVPFVTASAAVMAALSPVRSPSPIVALAQRPPIDDSRVYAARDPDGPHGSSAEPFVVIATDIQDPGNLGAVVRVAEAAGASGVVAAGACADPFSWKALRGSMGSAFRLPIGIASDAAAAVSAARARGCRIIATTPRNGRSIFDVDLRCAAAVLIGGEGPGLPRALIERADDRVTIPMASTVESLNAAATAAVILYEAFRQRGPART